MAVVAKAGSYQYDAAIKAAADATNTSDAHLE